MRLAIASKDPPIRLNNSMAGKIMVVKRGGKLSTRGRIARTLNGNTFIIPQNCSPFFINLSMPTEGLLKLKLHIYLLFQYL